MEALIIILIIVALLILIMIGMYNGLVTLRNKVKESWAQVDVMLKRRSDLIPNLIETVKGYATHEKTTLDAVIQARSNFDSAKSVKDEIAASNELTQTLGKLFALSEAYPDLKANQNFLRLQEDLADTENKIATTREVYNGSVNVYNNKVEQFPSNIVAGMFKFVVSEFFNIPETEKEVPKVQF